MQMAQAETRNLFRQIIGEANRANASFYTIDAAGLRAGPQRRITTGVVDTLVESRQRDHEPFGSTLDTIRTFGEATGGLAIVDSNDLAGGLQRVVDDLKLVLPPRLQLDQRQERRPLSEDPRDRSKRPGVEVRAREGYFARRASDTSKESTLKETRPVTRRREHGDERAGLPPPRTPLVAAHAVCGAQDAGGPPGASVVVTSSLRSIGRCSNTPEWREGADVEATIRLSNGNSAGATKARLEAGATVIRVDVPLTSPAATI